MLLYESGVLMDMPRMRTLNAAVEYFKSQDPDTCITKHFLYTEVRAGRLPGVIMAGNKYLLDIDQVERFLADGTEKLTAERECEKPLNYGKLRKVRV
ncbi:MAG TPA: hypothetical protein DHV55_09825 [Clostridiaceae bacterium]|nr:hypothetical protein [Clostridiaceae bacterium]